MNELWTPPVPESVPDLGRPRPKISRQMRRSAVRQVLLDTLNEGEQFRALPRKQRRQLAREIARGIK